MLSNSPSISRDGKGYIGGSPIRGRETSNDVSRPMSKSAARGQKSKSPPKSKQKGAQSQPAVNFEDVINKSDNDLIKLLNTVESVNIVLELEIEGLVTANPRLLTAIDSATRDTGMHSACSRIHFLSNSAVCFLIDSCGKALETPNLLGMLPLHKAMLAKPRFISTRKRLNEREEDALLRLQSPITVDNIYMLIEGCSKSLIAQNVEGQTPLHCCLSHPHTHTLDIVSCLLEDPQGIQACSIIDKYGYCPLHIAAGNRRIPESVIELLINAYPSATEVRDVKG